MKLTCLSLLATVAMVTCQQHTTHPHGPQTTTQAMTTPMVTGTTSSLAPPDVTGGASPTAGPTTSAPTTAQMVSTTSPPDTTQPPATTAPVVVDTSTPSAQPVTPQPTQSPTNQTTKPVTVAAASSTPAPTTTTAPPTTTRPGPQSFYPSIDEIVDAFRRLSESEYFQKLNYENQMLVLELVSGGQAGQIKEILDSRGWERILTFIYDLPFRYLDTLMQFILGGLERERLIQAAAGSV